MWKRALLEPAQRPRPSSPVPATATAAAGSPRLKTSQLQAESMVQPDAASAPELGHDFRQIAIVPVQGQGQEYPVQRQGGGDPRHEVAAQIRHAARQGTSGAGGPLPFLDAIQRSFGKHDVSGIVAHTDSSAAAASRVMGAKAFATGNAVGFAGSPDLHTAAHEAAHIIQQQRGVVTPDGVGRSRDRYERQADAVADLVVQGKSSQALLDADVGKTAPVSPSPALQRETQSDQVLVPGRFLVDGSGTLASGQVHKDAFLKALRQSVYDSAAKVLAAVGETPADCPYITYWFSFYETKGAARIEKAIARYVPAADQAQSWQAVVGLVTERVREGLQRNVDSGSLEGVPEELPKTLHEKSQQPPKESTSSQGDSVQLCAVPESEGTRRARELRAAGADMTLGLLYGAATRLQRGYYPDEREGVFRENAQQLAERVTRYRNQFINGCTGAAAAIGQYLLPGSAPSADDYGGRTPAKLDGSAKPLTRLQLSTFLSAAGNYFFRFKAQDVLSHEYVVVKIGNTFDLYESDVNPTEIRDQIHLLDEKRQGQNAKNLNGVDAVIAQINPRLGEFTENQVTRYKVEVHRVPL